MFLEQKRLGENTTIEPWRQLLLDAADYMEQRGRCRFNVASRDDGKVCTLGAMHRFYTCHSVYDEAVRRFSLFVSPGYHPSSATVSIWNDNFFAFWRTKSYMVRKLRKCALSR